MSRVRRGFKARQRRNKILKRASGFHFSRRTKFRMAVETVKRALHYSYIGRRLIKRDMRRLWITRISAAAKSFGGSYSKFINDLNKSGACINRKMLSEIAATDSKGFEVIYKQVSK